MRGRNIRCSGLGDQRRSAVQYRQCALLALLLAVAACNQIGGFRDDKAPEGFAGLVAGDEPRATLVGREILERGGSAADAATAMYFALAVTRPSMASLGAAGACVVYDRTTNKAEGFEFVPPVAGPEGPVAAPPMAPRGMYALQASYGRLRWEELVAPAENLARFGTTISRTFAADIEASRKLIAADPGLSKLLTRPGTGADGEPGYLAEGDQIVQPELAGWLALVRERGPGPLYEGGRAAALVNAYAAAGTPLGPAALIEAKPRIVAPVVLEVDDHKLALLPDYATAGPYQALLWGELWPRDRFSRTFGTDRLHMLAEASARAEGIAGPARQVRRWESIKASEVRPMGASLMRSFDPHRHQAASALALAPIPQPRDDSGTSVAVLDRSGQAVACGFTMGRRFGVGRMAPDTGILPAASPVADIGLSSLGPLVVYNTSTKTAFLAAGGAGAGAPASLVALVIDLLQRDLSLDRSLAEPRIDAPGQPDMVGVEPQVPEPVKAALAERGHRVEEAPPLGRLNAVYCAKGAPRDVSSCVARSDPRGSGVGRVAGTPIPGQ